MLVARLLLSPFLADSMILGEDDELWLDNLLENEFGPGCLRHYEFLYGLSREVEQANGRNGGEQRLGITNSDITLIIAAWDTYATRKDNMVELRTIEQCHAAAKKEMEDRQVFRQRQHRARCWRIRRDG
jgi:hypothetical protein